ncbi:hypothetical protein [Massilia sp. KIM]|uniref:hypothetical protein n=1 Tax=Massilia sp. KIM TaxID=1955422 RepID=UPI00117EF378|nr:hypothetical protein [Massilia sp. KIM]
MEKHLIDAWERIKAGNPENPRLLELAKKGRLKASPSSVAEEAGVSRTLIGYDDCRYAAVRRKILGEKLPSRAPTDMRSINSSLRQLNRTLEQRLKVALSEQAAMINRIRKIELEYDDKREEIARLQARAKRNPNEIVGLHLVPPKDED